MKDDEQNQLAGRIVSLGNLNIADLQPGPICIIQSFPNVKTATLSLGFRKAARNAYISKYELKTCKQVTTAGIRELPEGPFGKAIELFPFRGWSLEDVSHEELQLLCKEFSCNRL